MKSKLLEQLSETVNELERYEKYLSNSVDEETIWINKIRIQKLKLKIKEQVNSLLLKI